MIDGYGPLEPIGHGGFSTVYLARQEIFDRQVAVKVMNADLRDPGAKRRFLRECRVTGRLTGHPNIISVFDAGTTRDGRPYIAMEYIAGGSLADRMADTGRLAVEEVLRIGVQVADALVTAHRHGVLHRDLKPANILIRESGTAVLSDFGIAVVENAAEGTTASVAFTPRYASPEVLQGEEHTVASDIFGFGATLFALLAGQPPFTARVPAQLLRDMLDGPPPALPDDLPGTVPDDLVALLHRALAVAPQQRPSSAAGVLEELRAIGDVSGDQGGAPASADDPHAAPTMISRPADPVSASLPPPSSSGGTSGGPTPQPHPGAGRAAGRGVEPVVPAAAIPDAATPDAATPGPATPEPATPEPDVPAPDGPGKRRGLGLLVPVACGFALAALLLLIPGAGLRSPIPEVTVSAGPPSVPGRFAPTVSGSGASATSVSLAERPATGAPAVGAPAAEAPAAAVSRPGAPAAAVPGAGLPAAGGPGARASSTGAPAAGPPAAGPPTGGQAAPTGVVSPQPGTGSCVTRNVATTDGAGRHFTQRYDCSTYVGSQVYANVRAEQESEELDDSGYMDVAATVWVICQFRGRANPVVQGNTNTWWLYTQGDHSRSNTHGYTAAWGYLPATVVTQGGQNQPVPGVPACSSYL
ncbi:serine/threonine-protein kinase [Protofrankia symbiont of Coriaria ruscifolia]|uniref:serine/threonine-protein kinase n=1 Tax=Protofrankia symbiont of Coriaria ruscifolia TaxID=1306542 RepID=UPI001F5E73C6|nr:serine/threonine-protein kinase [Protofrankia symbiont of Coriaria ruscifolia]